MKDIREKDFEFIGGLIPRELKERVVAWTFKNPSMNASDGILLGLAKMVGASKEDQDRWMRLKKGGKEAQ